MEKKYLMMYNKFKLYNLQLLPKNQRVLASRKGKYKEGSWLRVEFFSPTEA